MVAVLLFITGTPKKHILQEQAETWIYNHLKMYKHPAKIALHRYTVPKTNEVRQKVQFFF